MLKSNRRVRTNKHLLDFVAGDLVTVIEMDLERILGLVVAMPAAEHLAAARRPDPASPRVMLAASPAIKKKTKKKQKSPSKQTQVR
jgi:hypothetical protein